MSWVDKKIACANCGEIKRFTVIKKDTGICIRCTNHKEDKGTYPPRTKKEVSDAIPAILPKVSTPELEKKDSDSKSVTETKQMESSSAEKAEILRLKRELDNTYVKNDEDLDNLEKEVARLTVELGEAKKQGVNRSDPEEFKRMKEELTLTKQEIKDLKTAFEKQIEPPKKPELVEEKKETPKPPVKVMEEEKKTSPPKSASIEIPKGMRKPNARTYAHFLPESFAPNPYRRGY